MTWWSNLDWKAVSAAIPAVGALAIRARTSSLRGLEDSISRHLELRKAAEAIKYGTGGIDEILTEEIAELAKRARKKLHRKLDIAAVATFIFVVVAGGAITAGLLRLGSGNSWSWLWNTAGVIVAFFALALASAGIPQLWKDTSLEVKPDATQKK